MIEDKIDCDVAKELLTILAYCDNTFLDNIPDYVLKKLNNLAADSQKEYYVNKNKTLLEQDISDECKNLISVIYFMYMTDSELKKEIITKWSNNDYKTS